MSEVIQATLKDGRRIRATRDKVYLSTIAGWSGLQGSHMAPCWVITDEAGNWMGDMANRHGAASDTVKYPNRASVLGYMVEHMGAVLDKPAKMEDFISITKEEILVYCDNKDLQKFVFNKSVRKFDGAWALCVFTMKDGKPAYKVLGRGKTQASAVVAAFDKHMAENNI